MCWRHYYPKCLIKNPEYLQVQSYTPNISLKSFNQSLYGGAHKMSGAYHLGDMPMQYAY